MKLNRRIFAFAFTVILFPQASVLDSRQSSVASIKKVYTEQLDVICNSEDSPGLSTISSRIEEMARMQDMVEGCA